MTNDFTEVMLKRTDDQLIAILTVNRADYVEAALIAAQSEFDKRQMPSDQVDRITAEQKVIREKANLLANEPLEKETKILAMFLPLVARILYARKFRNGGYERKTEELNSAFFIGRLLYLGLIILFVVIVKLSR